MNTKKYYLVLVVVAGILCVGAVGAAELPLSEDKPFLIGRAYPALAGIEELCVAIMPEGVAPGKDGLVWKELRAKVEQKLDKTGIKMYSGDVPTYPARPKTPVLVADIRMLRLKDVQQYVFCVQISLSRPVYVAENGEVASPSQRELIVKADVWKSSSPMQVVSVQNMPAQVTKVVLEQVEAFIRAYLAANPPGKRAVDAQVSDTASPIAAKSAPPTGQAVAESMYVASKNSEVFHRPECRWAQKIAEKNLVRYSSRDEAIKAGKRPCKMCKP